MEVVYSLLPTSVALISETEHERTPRAKARLDVLKDLEAAARAAAPAQLAQGLTPPPILLAMPDADDEVGSCSSARSSCASPQFSSSNRGLPTPRSVATPRSPRSTPILQALTLTPAQLATVAQSVALVLQIALPGSSGALRTSSPVPT